VQEGANYTPTTPTLARPILGTRCVYAPSWLRRHLKQGIGLPASVPPNFLSLDGPGTHRSSGAPLGPSTTDEEYAPGSPAAEAPIWRACCTPSPGAQDRHGHDQCSRCHEAAPPRRRPKPSSRQCCFDGAVGNQ